jgi:hypothetical protein
VAKTTVPIHLPQVNPGNVALAVEAVRTTPEQNPLGVEWLGDMGINQPRQAQSMLRFLGLVDDSDRLLPAVVEAREDGEAFRALLTDCVRAAYADAGCGTPSSLGWLGRDRLSNQDIRERITLHGPLAQRDLKRGGARNAFYTLSALHELLLEPTAWRTRDAGGPQGPVQPKTLWRRTGPFAGQAAQPATENPVLTARLADADSARDFLRQTLGTSSPADGPQPSPPLVIPFVHRGNGETVTARIQIDAPIRPGDLARLGRVLQRLGEEMETPAD